MQKKAEDQLRDFEARLKGSKEGVTWEEVVKIREEIDLKLRQEI